MDKSLSPVKEGRDSMGPIKIFNKASARSKPVQGPQIALKDRSVSNSSTSSFVMQLKPLLVKQTSKGATSSLASAEPLEESSSSHIDLRAVMVADSSESMKKR